MVVRKRGSPETILEFSTGIHPQRLSLGVADWFIFSHDLLNFYPDPQEAFDACHNEHYPGRDGPGEGLLVPPSSPFLHN